MSKSFKMLSAKEFIEKYDNHPASKVYWEHSKKYLCAYKDVKGKKRELYHIPEYRCQTKEQQIDWINQISEKIWGHTRTFTKALKKACEDWGTW
tara:strand:- start:784 stop:1065 length:282 start_codon:yes stop_codon:yes gene_type:complete